MSDFRSDEPLSGFAPHPGLAFDAAGVPFDTVHGEVFRSRVGAWAEAQTVFVEGCGLRERWRGAERFCVLELGFGLGANFLATLATWRADPARPARLHVVSVEARPLSREDLERGLAAIGLGCEALAADRNALLADWPPALPGLHRLVFAGGAVTLTLAFGEASRIVPRLSLAADAIYLDGFSPERNPAMWRPALIRAVARHARPGARLATWTAASTVREALAVAGFEVRHLAGTGGKRHRIEAVWAPRWRTWAPPAEPPALSARHVLVVGAGLAGAAMAAGFADRGFEVTLVDEQPAVGGAGSRQPVIADHLHLSPDDNPMARLTRAALLLSASDRLRRVDGDRSPRPLGRLALDADTAEAQASQAMLTRLGFPSAFVRHLTVGEASEVAGLRLPHGGLWMPDCDAVSPGAAIANWIAEAGDALRFLGACRVDRLSHDSQTGLWHALAADGRTVASAPIVVLANAGDACRLGRIELPRLRRVRGQTSLLRHPAVSGLRTVLGGDAYAAPLPGGAPDILVGSSFDETDALAPDPRDDLGNMRRLGRMLGLDPQALAPTARSAAVGFRYALPDRLPAIGQLPDEAVAVRHASELARNDRLPIPLAPGLYGAFALGSRGLLWSALASQVLPGLVCGEPAPIERDLLEAIAPGRMLRRRLRRL
jgi:tRNA 5-methylaminomethyl-2-thiouridine biosynthesis bifunctional protein